RHAVKLLAQRHRILAHQLTPAHRLNPARGRRMPKLERSRQRTYTLAKPMGFARNKTNPPRPEVTKTLLVAIPPISDLAVKIVDTACRMGRTIKPNPFWRSSFTRLCSSTSCVLQ